MHNKQKHHLSGQGGGIPPKNRPVHDSNKRHEGYRAREICRSIGYYGAIIASYVIAVVTAHLGLYAWLNQNTTHYTLNFVLAAGAWFLCGLLIKEIKDRKT